MSMKNNQLKLIYCYDALCGWCYGFSPVIQKIALDFKEVLTVEVLSGGMILEEPPRPIIQMASYIQSAYKLVEEHTSIQFGSGFLNHIFTPEESSLFLHSEKPAIALSILKEYLPGKDVEIAAAIQYLLNFQGLDLTLDTSYQTLLERFSIPADDFYTKLHSHEYRDKAYYEFQLVKQLRVTSFPQVLLQVDDAKFYLVAKGYTDYTIIKTTLDAILKEIQSS